MSEQNNRVIIAGQLEFGSSRNYEQVVEQFEHRKENYYKNEILLKGEDIFGEDNRILDVPRKVVEGTDRQWLNTLNLLKRIASFSIAGDLRLWRLQDKQLLEEHVLEPRGDRTTTQLYLKGRELLDREDKLGEAKDALTEAIENFDRHSVAYERRGQTNYRLHNYKDAQYDYTKSIQISPSRPGPFYGRGLVNLLHLGNPQAAAEDFKMVAKLAIPYQDIYWLAWAMRGDALLQLGQKDAAIASYKFFLNRKQDHKNVRRLNRRVAMTLADLINEQGDCAAALPYYETALEAAADPKAETEAEIRYRYARCLQEIENPAWEEQARAAAEAGHEPARDMLRSRSGS